MSDGELLEMARMRRALHEIAEEWAGAECGEPVHAQEAYAIGLAKRMYALAVAGLMPLRTDERREHMSDLRAAAQKVVDAWGDPLGMKRLCEEIEALRAALAQPVPRRKWQGLTDEEVLRTLKWDEAMAPLTANGMPAEVLEAARQEAIERYCAIEAALKEKNHE